LHFTNRNTTTISFTGIIALHITLVCIFPRQKTFYRRCICIFIYLVLHIYFQFCILTYTLCLTTTW
jgi:hypothetical protein